MMVVAIAHLRRQKRRGGNEEIMIEVELKFAASEWGRLRERLERLGGRVLGTHDEVDEYFNAPDRDFAATDEALRIRTTGDQVLVAYKGPKLDPLTKTRREVEVALADGVAAAQRFAELLAALGYRPVAAVKKRRTRYDLEYHGRRVNVSLDDVAGVGRFVELEHVTEGSDAAAARQALLQLAADLGLEKSERRSYLEMLLASAKGAIDHAT